MKDLNLKITKMVTKLNLRELSPPVPKEIGENQIC